MSHSKGLKKELRRLAGLAYERELAQALTTLEQQFARWRAGEIDCFALNEMIHSHHNRVARQLYVFYQYGGDDTGVASAVARGFLTREELSPALLAKLESTIDYYIGSANSVRDTD